LKKKIKHFFPGICPEKMLFLNVPDLTSQKSKIHSFCDRINPGAALQKWGHVLLNYFEYLTANSFDRPFTNYGIN